MIACRKAPVELNFDFLCKYEITKKLKNNFLNKTMLTRVTNRKTIKPMQFFLKYFMTEKCTGKE